MDFKTFEQLSSEEVQNLIAAKVNNSVQPTIEPASQRQHQPPRSLIRVITKVQVPLAIAVPLAGLDKLGNSAADNLFDLLDYLFDDGVTALYMPLVGLPDPSAADQLSQWLAPLTNAAAIRWYGQHMIHTRFYGDFTGLPESAQQSVTRVHEARKPVNAPRQLRFGLHVESPATTIITQTLNLYRSQNRIPTDSDLMTQYYQMPPQPASLWIGIGSSIVTNVPMIITGQTALYFLQAPTQALTKNRWRRILFDYLFIRGDEETLYPDNLSDERYILGLTKPN